VDATAGGDPLVIRALLVGMVALSAAGKLFNNEATMTGSGEEGKEEGTMIKIPIALIT
jgi:hypothetical protein